MKNLVFLALFFVAILTPSFLAGQTNKFDIGVIGGSGMRLLTGKGINKEYSDPAIGYHIGSTFQYHLGKKFSIRTDPAFEQKGNTDNLILTDNVGNEIGQLKCKSNLNYIVLPVLGQVSFGNKIIFNLHAGFYCGYLIRHNYIIPPFDSNEGSKTNITGAVYKRFDMGLAGGFGCHFPVKDNLSIFLDTQLNAGLYNIRISSLFDPIYTNSVNLSIGIKYKFTKETKAENN